MIREVAKEWVKPEDMGVSLPRKPANEDERLEGYPLRLFQKFQK